ncbi:MAG TPA: hypothetical protein VFI31_20060 [Pirellulales bacterium]|nr:hypothetical protein [Pirellulales bacterium]
MNTFADLLTAKPPFDPADLQFRAQQSFPSRVSQSHLLMRKPCSPIPNTGIFVVIGAASYSPMELQLLDDVDAAHLNWHNQAQVAVFDVLDCQTTADFEKYLPGVGSVAQSPVVAIWEDGRLAAKQTGLRMVREVLQERHILS